MLFLMTMTFQGENKVAFLKRASELQAKGFGPPGAKIINEWSSLKGKRITALLEVEKPDALMEVTDTFDDLIDVDYDPVMPSADVAKLDFYVKKYSIKK